MLNVREVTPRSYLVKFTVNGQKRVPIIGDMPTVISTLKEVGADGFEHVVMEGYKIGSYVDVHSS